MARTAGAVSNVSVKWTDLKDMIPADFDGYVTVGAKWLAGFLAPTEDTIQMTRAEYERLTKGEVSEQIETKRATSNAPIAAAVRFTIEED